MTAALGHLLSAKFVLRFLLHNYNYIFYCDNRMKKSGIFQDL